MSGRRQAKLAKQLIVLPIGLATFDDSVLTLDVAEFAQSTAKHSQKLRIRPGRTWTEPADYWHRPLLRARSERHAVAAPLRSVMNSRGLISAPSSGDSIVSAQTSTLIGAGNRHQNHCRSAQPMSLMSIPDKALVVVKIGPQITSWVLSSVSP
jgi:hypothetical protein